MKITETAVGTLVQSALDKKYSEFDASTKEILSQKVAAKLAEAGYFDRLNTAKGLQEGENPFAKKDDEKKDKSEDKETDDKDAEKEEKPKKKNPFAKKDDSEDSDEDKKED